MTDQFLLQVGDQDHGDEQHCVGAQFLLSGHNVFQHRWYTGDIDGAYGPSSGKAAKQCKWDIGYAADKCDSSFGVLLANYLKGETRRSTAMVLRAKKRTQASRHKFIFPTQPKGRLIGFPGVGTHSYYYPPNNWESDSSYDIGVPVGTKIVAVADGRIGPEFGPLPDPASRFHGIRLHLETADNEFYYAHLSSTFPGVHPGAHVKQGDILGASGSANGVAHLHIGMKHLVSISTFA